MGSPGGRMPSQECKKCGVKYYYKEKECSRCGGPLTKINYVILD